MTEPVAAPPVGAAPDKGPDPGHPPATGDYLWGVSAVVGLLALIVVATWLALVILFGVDFCGCTTRPPATPFP